MSVQTLLRITHLAHRKSYIVIICSNSHEKLTKIKIRLSLNKRPVGLIAPPFKINFLATKNLPKMNEVGSNIASDNLLVPK